MSKTIEIMNVVEDYVDLDDNEYDALEDALNDAFEFTEGTIDDIMSVIRFTVEGTAAFDAIEGTIQDFLDID